MAERQSRRSDERRRSFWSGTIWAGRSVRLVPPESGYLSRDATLSRIPGRGQPPTDESRRSRGSV
jgi:hypothetical protein